MRTVSKRLAQIETTAARRKVRKNEIIVPIRFFQQSHEDPEIWNSDEDVYSTAELSALPTSSDGRISKILVMSHCWKKQEDGTWQHVEPQRDFDSDIEETVDWEDSSVA